MAHIIINPSFVESESILDMLFEKILTGEIWFLIHVGLKALSREF